MHGHAYGEHAEITYLYSIVHNNGVSCLEDTTNQTDPGCHGLAEHECRAWPIRTETRTQTSGVERCVLTPLVFVAIFFLLFPLSCLPCCKTRKSAFTGSRGIARKTAPSQRLLHETELRRATSSVLGRQPRHYGHVARLPNVDPAHTVVSARDNTKWKRPRGHPRNS